MVDFNKVIETAAGGNLGSLILKLESLTLNTVCHGISELNAISGNIEFLKEELEILHAVLLDLSNQEDPSHQLKLWKNKIRELSYNLEDAIDSFELASKNSHMRSHQEDQDHNLSKRIVEAVQKCKDRITSLPSEYRITKEIQRLKDRVDIADDRHKRLRTASYGQGTSNDGIAIRDFARYADPEGLVGIDASRDDIISMLTRHVEHRLQRMVLAIFGFGGVGKTTLATQVFNRIRGGFDCRAFVSVSRNPDIKKILIDILLGFKSRDTRQDLQQLDKHHLIEKLREFVENKRYLVVVDDVWTKGVWTGIEAALYDNKCGSRIIVTTRNSDVAEFCSSRNGHTYKLDPLGDDEAEKLLTTKAFPHTGCPPNLNDVCRKILKKCGGSPLAILTLAGLLANKETQDQWDAVLHSLNDPAVPQDSTVIGMRKILSFSYFDLPEHLRTCLLYLSLFPEDYVIKRKHLVNRWIAQGFISGGESKTRTGEGYFNDLISRCLIQPVYIQPDGLARACKVHDTMWDFIKIKSVEENHVTFFATGAQDQGTHNWARHLSIQDVEVFTGQAKQEASPARSISVFGETNSMALYQSILRFSCLRVLHMDYKTGDGIFPLHRDGVINFDVSRLFHLKYMHLGFSWKKIKITGIMNLQSLETLHLGNSRLSEFPADIFKLQKLVRLFTNDFVRLPDGIGEMKVLEELKVIHTNRCSLEFLRDLGRLTKLRSVGIHLPDGRDQEKDLILISSLEKLGIMYSLQSLTVDGSEDTREYTLLDDSDGLSWGAALRKIRNFQMKGRVRFAKFPEWMSSLNGLEKLDLSVCDIGQEDLEMLAKLPILLYLILKLDHYPKEGLTFRGSATFKRLKYLEINCYAKCTKLTFETRSLRLVDRLYIHLRICDYFNDRIQKCRYFGKRIQECDSSDENLQECDSSDENLQEYDSSDENLQECDSSNKTNRSGFYFQIGHLDLLTRIDVNVHKYSLFTDQCLEAAATIIRNAVNELPIKPKLQIHYYYENF